MATSTHSFSLPLRGMKSIRDIVLLRLTTGYILLIVSLIGFFGGDWDIQWHAVVGRDRTFTPPHIMILAAIGLGGLVALGSILIETSWARHNRELEQVSIDFLGFLQSSLGTYMVGFGAVTSAVAFPLDTYWHSLYGIDVSLWAPFHIMLSAGGLITLFGILYILLSAAHLAESQQQRWSSILAYSGLLLGLGELLSKLCTLAFPALSGQGTLHLAGGALMLFPFIMSALAAIACALAVRVLKWPGSATLTVGVFLLLYLVVSTFVPPAMVALVQAEHQQYLPRAAQIGSLIVPLLGQTPFLLLTGVAIDAAVWLARGRKWSRAATDRCIIAAAMLGMLVVTTITLITLSSGQASTQGPGKGLGIMLLLSFLLALPGGFIGSWLGLRIGTAIQKLQR